MLKGHLGIVAAVVTLLVTVAAFLLVSSDAKEKAERESRARVGAAFNATRTVLDLDAQASKSHAQHYAVRTRTILEALDKYRRTVTADIAQVTQAMGDDSKPDFVAFVNNDRVLDWANGGTNLLKEGLRPDAATHLRLQGQKFVDDVLSPKGVPDAQAGTLMIPGVFRTPVPAAAAPFLGQGNKVVGAVIVGWLGKSDPKEMKEKAQTFARSINVVNLLMPKQRVLTDLANQFQGEFADELRKRWGVQPAFIGVLDESGVLMLRGDGSRLYVGSQFAKESLALQTTLAQHQATTEVWLKAKVVDMAKDSSATGSSESRPPELLRVGFAPIMLPQGKLAGVLVLGWAVGDVRATQLRKSTGTHVAFLYKDAIASTTMKQAKASVLGKAEVASVTPQDWTVPKPSRLTVEDQPYLAVAGVFPETGDSGSTFVLFTSVEEVRARYDYARFTIVVVGVLLALLFLIVNLTIRRHFILPISELERGVAELVAGNLEYQFGVPSAETEGLAFSLNDLLAQFLGRPAPGEEEDEEGGENGGQTAGRVVFSLGPLPQRAYGRGDSGMLPRLDEAKDTYYKRIFADYLAAMKESGADVSGITLKAFQAKLEVNERLICTRLKCTEVRFTVQSSEEGIVLQPFPIS